MYAQIGIVGGGNISWESLLIPAVDIVPRGLGFQRLRCPIFKKK